MSKFLKRVWKWISLPTDLGSLLGFFGLSGGLGAVTGVLIQRFEEKPYWAIIGACVVFAAVMHGLYYGAALYRQFRVFRNLRILSPIIIDLGANAPKKIINPTFGVQIFNSAQRVIYARIKRAHNSIEGRVSPYDPGEMVAGALLPGSPATLTFTTIPNIDVSASNPVTGKLDFEIEYGADPQDMAYLVHHESDLQIPIDWPTTPEGQGNARLASFVKRSEHTKA